MTKLPEAFRHVRLVLAREIGHPGGDRDHGYDLLLPLDMERHIDIELFKQHGDKCRVRRFRPDEEDAVGLLKRGPGGRWYFDYDETTDSDDEAGFRFTDERFEIGEYVSVREDDGEMHTFVVAQVEHL